MTFGDIFAVFVLHQNAARVGAGLTAAANATPAGDSASVPVHLTDVGSFLENRGTRGRYSRPHDRFWLSRPVLAALQPWVAFGEKTKRCLSPKFRMGLK
jgi:hypothetical protein